MWQAISFSDFLPPVTFWSSIWPFVFLFSVVINSLMGKAPYLGVVPAGVVEHEHGLGIMVLAGNSLEAVGGASAPANMPPKASQRYLTVFSPR
ncbi:MAG: hypothetical protein VR68_02235 [Peptococcaceae bacterium BRH_c4a]|nr:MAG: hypothetical protein VR68_02235 [Peptococcaceae bacterium BRH_c4a]